MASAKDDKQFKYDAGNTLLALREKAGMTQPELAEKIHVEQTRFIVTKKAKGR